MNQQEELDVLKRRIDKFKPPPQEPSVAKDKLDAFSISIEIVAGVIVGLITGMILDKIFTTKPLFLIICLIMGMIASARVIWQKGKNSKNDS
jgi:F0F1-type ATP synthase assembly protein I